MHFFENWSQRGEIQKRRPCVLMWTANLHTLCIDDTIAPTLTSSLWPLNPTMSHNNNNSGLHAIFVFLLCSVSPSTVCLYTARKLYTHALLLCFWWISSATYRPGIPTKAHWVVHKGSIWTQIFLKLCRGRRGGKKIILVRADMAAVNTFRNSCLIA